MAETKTTIPVEIKMGNAGTNDANLPAFKEGSIIFTKDTKKIYIDPVGETERIAVGGSAEDGVGQKTADGGEIFNDYENNQGLSDKSHAEGTETIAGSKAFIVQSYTAATTAYESYPTFTLDGIEGLAVDDIYSLSASGWKNAEEIGKIVEISGNTVKVTAVPSDIGNVDFTQITCYFRITAKPTVGSTAFGTAAHSEGYHTYSEALGSHAEGANTIAGGKYSHAEGSSTFAGYAAHAEGKNTKAVTEGSHAEGLGTGATGYGAHAEGSGSEAKALGSHAEGRQTKAIVDYSHSEGYLTQASGKASHAEGYGTLSGDTTSLTATTDSATDNGLYTHAEGNGSIASGHAAHAEGRDTQATGFCDHAEGQSTVASGSRSHAEGQNTKASNKNSHAEGEGSTANGRAAHAEGLSTKANGTNSHAEGESNEVTGKNSHAEGYNNTVSGESSHAEGAGNTVTKYYGHAEGYSNTVSGNYSHAEGRGNTVTGERSHAENDYNNVSGNYSHAEGGSNKLSGDYSHVGGRANVNSKNYSFMQGYALKNETANYKSVLGKFNADNENNLFEIGNGYYVQDADDVRSNAFVVNKDGYAEVQSQGTTDNSVIIKKTLDNSLENKQDVFCDVTDNSIASDGSYIKLGNFKYFDKTNNNLVQKDDAKLAIENLVVPQIDFDYNPNGLTQDTFRLVFSQPGGGSLQLCRVKSDGEIDEANFMQITPSFFYVQQIAAKSFVNGPYTIAYVIENDDTYKLRVTNDAGNSVITGLSAGTADNDAVNVKQLNSAIATQVSSVYKAKGSIADISALPTPDKDHEGFVYNIENEFTTTDLFIEGAGKTYPAGTNVVIVNTTGTTYKYDVLAGMVDLSNYVTRTDLSGKLDKVTSTGTYRRAYSVFQNGTNYMQNIDYNATGDSLVLRTSTGIVRGATPTDDNDLTTKKYVDDAIGNITALFASLVDMTKTTTQSDEPSDDTEIINEPTDNEEETVNG